jgi:hypothetical protein
LKECITNFIAEGDHIKVTASKYSFPTVCKQDQATDWFNSLSKCLHWNKRERQKSFAIVESNREATKSVPTTPKHTNNGHQGFLSMASINGSGGGSTSQRNYSRKNFGLSNNQSRSSSPPLHQHYNHHKKHSPIETSSSSSVDGLHDEVFAMFIDDEYHHVFDDEESDDEEYIKSTNFFDSDEELDDDSSIEDGFNGWTDEEINKARFASKLSNEMENLSISK